MKITTMKFIDRFAGVPMCLLLGLWNRFIQRRSPRHGEPRNILIMKFFGMGSVILTMPGVLSLRNRFPDAKITYCTFESNRSLLKRYPIVDQVLTIDATSISSFIGDTWRTIRAIRSSHYDIVFDFEFFSKFSTLLSALSDAPRIVGFSLPTIWRRFHLTDEVELTKDRHVSRAFHSLIERCTGSMDFPSPPPLTLLEVDRASMAEVISLDEQRIIAVNVNAGQTFLERRWPQERFAELVSRLASTIDARFIFIGTADEYTYVDRVIARSSCGNRCFNAAGLLSVPQLAAFLRRCELLISNDSGTLHLASTLGVPVVGLYGPETPSFYGPLGESTVVMYKDLPCSPCMNIYAAKSFRCPYDAKCMREISVDEVEHVLQSCLTEA